MAGGTAGLEVEDGASTRGGARSCRRGGGDARCITAVVEAAVTGGALVVGAAPDSAEDLGGRLAEETRKWLNARPSTASRRAYTADLGLRLPVRHPEKGPARGVVRAGCTWLVWLHANGLQPLTATEDDVIRWLHALRDNGFSAATRARALAAIRSWYRHLTRAGLVKKSPAAEVSPGAQGIHVAQKSPTIVLTADQVVALILATDRTRGAMRLRAAAIVALLFLLGLRVGELCALQVQDRVRHGGTRKVRIRGKGGRERRVDIPRPADERLDRYLATRQELRTVVVRGQGGGRGSVPLLATRTGRPITPPEVFRLLRRLAAEAGLPAEVIAALTPHVGRHTTAELARLAGHDVHEIMELLGHASITTTQRYMHGSGEQVPTSVATLLAPMLEVQAETAPP